MQADVGCSSGVSYFFEVGLLTEHRAHGQGTLESACFTPSALELDIALLFLAISA